MAFLTFCTNKECRKQMEPYIEPKTDKVYCSACDTEVLNITYFAKQQMKSLKQFRPKNTTSFAVKCQNCNKEDRPTIQKDKLYCSRL